MYTWWKSMRSFQAPHTYTHVPQYRWSGAERTSVTLGEGKTSYCTWGRELIKQYIEDAIELVRTSLTTGDWDK